MVRDAGLTHHLRGAFGVSEGAGLEAAGCAGPSASADVTTVRVAQRAAALRVPSAGRADAIPNGSPPAETRRLVVRARASADRKNIEGRPRPRPRAIRSPRAALRKKAGCGRAPPYVGNSTRRPRGDGIERPHAPLLERGAGVRWIAHDCAGGGRSTSGVDDSYRGGGRYGDPTRTGRGRGSFEVQAPRRAGGAAGWRTCTSRSRRAGAT